MDMTIDEFCERHRACQDGRDWALSNCETMDEVWRDARPEWLIWVAMRNGVLTDRELRLFAVWAASQSKHLMTDLRSLTALKVSERYANGDATKEELNAACDAASCAARAALRVADNLASYAACAAARYTAYPAASDAAWHVCHAARDAARDAQAQWLRDNTTPCFSVPMEVT
mgnify:CR=1 FL=1